MPTPKADQVIVRVEATPINPSDHGVMFGWSDMSKAASTGSGKDTVLTAPVPPAGAIHQTGATLGFDATGGGKLASDILTAMEAAAARTPGAYSIYGSIKHKQVYLYGGLDTSLTTLSRGYGMAWGVGGWLLPNFLAKAGPEVGVRLRQRVAKELKTTFASHYTDEISLSQALQADIVTRYNAKMTGEKFLICPQMDV